MEHGDGISTYGNRRQSVPSGNSSYGKRTLVRVNGLSNNAGTGMGALHYLGSSRDSAPRLCRLGKISVHFLSLT